MTAGNGGNANNILQVSLEYKGQYLITFMNPRIGNKIFNVDIFAGVSFSIGGEKTWREYLTIPNILKEFNPNLYGYSLSVGLSIHESSKFNAAELGAMSRDTPHMTKVLIQRMQSDEYVKPHHWKVISLAATFNIKIKVSFL